MRDRNIGNARNCLADECFPFIHAEHACVLTGVIQYRYEHMFKALGSPLYDIQMPYGKGIKASGKNRFHRSSPKYLI